MPVPLDEFPIHQGPQTMTCLVTCDRNTYDRCIMHDLSRRGRVRAGTLTRMPAGKRGVAGTARSDELARRAQ